MEKLLKLLNEYEKKAVVHWYERYGQDVLMCRYIKNNFEYYTDEATTIAISKYYGFIERLVQNNKIDKACLFFNTADLPDDNVSKLLMLLAISDNPIEDLISYLK